MRIILGLIMIVVGFLITWKSDWLVSNFGTISWAEQHISTSGGSRLLWKLIGILTIFIGMLVTTNLLQGVIVSMVSSIFPGAK
ncbi:hypothetical protein HOE31_01240 [bacterium]|jgi:hypothetical protein|nr:hypothetical protein [bacterium]MBT4335613.1 hypothetical protein [bacterium]MBT4495815.1 hypothetical protein [bacterium]MBT4763692.1 hypothetical protein [bacterium]MBT5401063.1 hypothetical protein [bacterium]